MKKSSYLSKKAGWAFLITCFSTVVLLGSCIKERKQEPMPVGDAKIKFVNTVSGSGAQDAFVTNTKLGTPLAYGASSEYFTTTTDNTIFLFKETGTSTVNASAQGLLEIGSQATFYYASSNSTSTKFVYPIGDDRTAPDAGKAKVRFANFNSYLANTTPLSVKLQGEGGAELAKDLQFGNASSFSKYNSITPGAKFSVTYLGLPTPFLIDDANLVAGKNYTIWIGGASAAALDYHIVEN